jgi:hypothetical protein
MLCSDGGAAAGRACARRIDSTIAVISVRAMVLNAVAGNLLLLECALLPSASSCVRDLRRRGASCVVDVDVDDSLVSVDVVLCREPFFLCRDLLRRDESLVSSLTAPECQFVIKIII